MKSEQPSYERYQRQVILKGFGQAAQQKLLESRVLLIGAGGLGCPALQYLAAAGIGHICIVDNGVVSLTNLHRQVLYTIFDVGFPKVEIAKHHLAQLNPDIDITVCNERLTTKNALSLIDACDIVIDATDNFASRYMINDACVLLNKPVVYGAVSQFEGQVAVFNYQYKTGNISVSYRDLFPSPPKPGEVSTCAEAGVLGVLPGIIGTMQANEVIKLVTGIGKPLVNSLLNYNALTNQVYEIALSKNKESQPLMPQSLNEFKHTNYDRFCDSRNLQFEIDGPAFDRLIQREENTIIDVREQVELPVITAFDHVQISFSEFKEKMQSIESGTVVLFCQTGKRSLQAAQWMFDVFGDTKKIYSLRGGILEWLTDKSTP